MCVESSQGPRLPGVAYVPLAVEADGAFDLCVIYRATEPSQLPDAFLESVRAVASER